MSKTATGLAILGSFTLAVVSSGCRDAQGKSSGGRKVNYARVEEISGFHNDMVRSVVTETPSRLNELYKLSPEETYAYIERIEKYKAELQAPVKQARKAKKDPAVTEYNQHLIKACDDALVYFKWSLHPDSNTKPWVEKLNKRERREERERNEGRLW